MQTCDPHHRSAGTENGLIPDNSFLYFISQTLGHNLKHMYKIPAELSCHSSFTTDGFSICPLVHMKALFLYAGLAPPNLKLYLGVQF